MMLLLLSGSKSIYADAEAYRADTVVSPATDSSTLPPAPLTTSTDSIPLPELTPVTVTAGKRERLMETAQSFSVIRSDEWTGSGKSVADIIADQTGVQTRRYGGTGSFQTISVRGVRGSEVLVLLDGLPLNSAMGGPVDLGKINPTLIDEIEVFRGVTPGQFGGNSIGGVINLKSKSFAHSKVLDGHVAAGNYGNQSYSVVAAIDNGSRFKANAAASLLHSNNDFRYLDRNNTIYNNQDDAVRTLENARYTASDFRLQPSLQLSSERRCTGSLSVNFINQELPAPEGKVNRTARYTEQRQSALFLLANESDEQKVGFSPRIGYTRSKALTVATMLDEGFGASHGTADYSEYGFIDHQVSADMQLKLYPSDHFSVTPVVNLLLEDGNPTSDHDDIGHGDWHSREAQLGAVCEVQYEHGPFTFTSTVSLRGVYSETDGGIDAFSNRMVPPGDTSTAIWAISGGCSCRPHPALLVFFNAGRYSSPPSLRERFGGRGALMSNPQLIPETGINTETGIKWNGHNFYVECAGFLTRSRNTIIIIRDGYQSKPKNCEGANISGVEASVLTEPLKFLSFDIKCTVQKPVNLTLDPPWEGRLLPDEPTLKCSFGCKLSPLRPLSLSYRGEFKSVYFHDPANTDAFRVPIITDGAKMETGSYFQHLSATWEISKNFTVIVTANNVNASILPTFPVSTIESGYSWTLYPSNELRCTVKYLF